MPTLRIATRRSPLAMWQAEHVAAEPGEAVAGVLLDSGAGDILRQVYADAG